MSSPDPSDPYGYHTRPDPYGAGQYQPESVYPPPPPPIPYAQQPYPPVYGQPMYMPAKPSSGYATGALVCGILGLFLIAPSVLAIALGHVAMKETKGGRMRGGGAAAAGLTLGYLVAVPAIAFAVMFYFS